MMHVWQGKTLILPRRVPHDIALTRECGNSPCWRLEWRGADSPTVGFQPMALCSGRCFCSGPQAEIEGIFQGRSRGNNVVLGHQIGSLLPLLRSVKSLVELHGEGEVRGDRARFHQPCPRCQSSGT